MTDKNIHENVELNQQVQEALSRPLMSEDEFLKLTNKMQTYGIKTREIVQTLAFEALRLAMPKMVQDVDEEGKPKVDEDNNPVMIDVGSQYQYATNLVMSVTKFMSKRNGNQLRLYFLEFAPMRWVKTKNKNVVTNDYSFRKDKSSNKEFDLEQAYVRKWFTIDGFTTEEKQEVIISYQKNQTALTRQINKLKKDIETDSFENPTIDKPLCESLLTKLELVNEEQKALEESLKAA